MSYVIRFIERRSPKILSIEMVFNEIKKYLNATNKYSLTASIMPFGFGTLAVFSNLLFFKREKADIYHITGDVHYIALRLPTNKTVITVHDAVLLNTRKGLRRYILKKLYYDLPFSRAKYITVISENTKKELIEKTSCDPKKIRVIKNPIRDIFNAATRKEFSDLPVVLQVGTRSNKNLINVAKALKGVECHLRIIGEPDDESVNILKDSNIRFSVVHDLSDAELLNEYRSADIVAFCSTYEGFGLPILEAQSMNVPLITSDLSPMKEVAGGGAILVDPYEPSSIRDAVIQIIENKDLRETLIDKGRENLSNYSLDSVGAQYEALYDEILNAG